MVDSTCTLAAPPAPPAPDDPLPPAAAGSERECNEAVRLDLARLTEIDMPSVATRLLNGDPWAIEPRVNVHPAQAQLVHQAMPLLGRLCRDGRLVTYDEVIPFRFLATRCAHAGIDSRQAMRTVTDAAEAVVDAMLPRVRELDDLYGPRNVDAAVTVLCGVLDNFAARAAAQVKEGYAAYGASLMRWEDRERTRALRPLDEHSGRTRRDRTSRAVLVMVASSRTGSRQALASAAKEIEVHVAGAIDLGLRRAEPAHHRVVIPVRDDAAWRRAYPLLRYIAVIHGVVILTRPPVVGLPALRACYDDLRRSLREAPRETVKRSGVVPSLDNAPTADAPAPVAA